MAKLLVTVSGGTVSSSVKDGLVKLEKQSPVASYLMGKNVETKFISPANYSSENARPEDYRDVLKAVSEACSKSRPDGILILHGTDTMAYFAQLAARALSYLKIPFVITGSKIPPDSEGTDAFKNIDYAVEQVTKGVSGVVFTTHEGITSIIPADKVTSPDIFGDYGSGPTARIRISLRKDIRQLPGAFSPPESFTGYRSSRPHRLRESLTMALIQCS